VLWESAPAKADCDGEDGTGDQGAGGIMQFHLNGFEPGDPEIFDQSERYPASGAQGSLPDEVDVLIVGCGPAGLTLAAQLSAFPDIKTCIVERKVGPAKLTASPAATHAQAAQDDTEVR
jgi:hypothetical protein